jgi:restriction system protein
MGYGGSNPERGIHTGGPNDAGIDGTIFEDRLGLERIHIQAKRYASDRPVKRPEIQKFAGALNRIRKGVFITTSSFDRRAIDFAASHEKTIALIDGDMLCQLMIAHGVGVEIVQSYPVFRVDGDYFGGTE